MICMAAKIMTQAGAEWVGSYGFDESDWLPVVVQVPQWASYTTDHRFR
jgi:hypothetical protein